MAYFFTVVTQDVQPNFGRAANKHNTALNNYLKYGIPSDQENFGVTKTALPKPKEVESMVTVQTVLDHNIYTTTFLCCEDEGEEKSERY